MDHATSPANSTHLSEEELRDFKEKLIQLQEKTREEIDELKSRLDEINKNADDTQSSQDHHQGDLATTESNKNVILSSIERNTEKMDQITVALDRIETGNYGICIETGQKIQKGRLEAMPYAIRCVGSKK